MVNDNLTAWKFEVNSQTYRIPIRITNPETKVSIIKYCIFDTGYTGYCSLEHLTIAQLGLKRVGMGKALTIQGSIEYQNYEAFLEIVNEEKTTINQISNLDDPSKPIPIQEMGINLIGIKLINQNKWLIAGDQQILVLIGKKND